jgi:type I site-specific restriction-modification system R (restriction) subunit
VIITDRDELDKQIEGVFGGAGETIQRSSSGRELMQALNHLKGQPVLRELPVAATAAPVAAAAR